MTAHVTYWTGPTIGHLTGVTDLDLRDAEFRRDDLVGYLPNGARCHIPMWRVIELHMPERRRWPSRWVGPVVAAAALLAAVTLAGRDTYRHVDSDTGRRCVEDEYRDLNGRCIHIDTLTEGT